MGGVGVGRWSALSLTIPQARVPASLSSHAHIHASPPLSVSHLSPSPSPPPPHTHPHIHLHTHTHTHTHTHLGVLGEARIQEVAARLLGRLARARGGGQALTHKVHHLGGVGGEGLRVENAFCMKSRIESTT